jgi:hypothetical protein
MITGVIIILSILEIFTKKFLSNNNSKYEKSIDKGEGIVIHHTKMGEIILENTVLNKQVMITNRHNILTNVQLEDINFERVDKLENAYNAHQLVVKYGFGIERFINRVALVWWTLYPDGRFFEDEDGFGGENCNETTVYAYMDILGKIIIPFRDMTAEEIKLFRIEAEETYPDL